MLSFATEIPVKHRYRKEDFLSTIRDWILGSPHTRLASDHLEGFATEPEARFQLGLESIETMTAISEDEEATGVRYGKREQDLVWITTAVFSRRSADSWVGIRVSCESQHPAAQLPAGKKPVLVRLLLDTLGGARDGPLDVGDAALRLEDNDIGLAARLISGRSGCRLPIVYISAGFHGRYLVDPDRLAHDLAGVAHVVVEPNRPFSLRLKIEVDSENVYGGTVGVYWPEGGGRRSFFIGQGCDSGGDVARAVLEEVRTALTNRWPLDRCTWAHVQERASRQAIQSLQAAGSQEIKKYIETFDKEHAARKEQIDDANREITRLRGELQIHRARFEAGTGSLLRAGAEQDLYPNEVLAIVRDAIRDAESHAVKDSRRQHVLSAVLQANPAPDDIAGTMREELKQLLRGARGLDPRSRRGLEEMGFSITEEGKHYKLTFRDDDRYTFAFPKSGSDHRGGLNAAKDIARLLF